VYAFHLNIPEGAKTLEASYQFLSPVRDSEGRIVVTPEMLNVQWEQVSLYPAGHFTRQIRLRPSIILPEGWTGVAALDGAKVTANRIDYAETDYETFRCLLAGITANGIWATTSRSTSGPMPPSFWKRNLNRSRRIRRWSTRRFCCSVPNILTVTNFFSR
jgi:Peptidase M61 N-terminal domain